MIFAARQTLKKVREHQESLFVLFIDLKKAYDFVPKCATWNVLARCGKHRVVRAGPIITKEFEIHNGLRQGCTLAQSIFNVYFAAMVSSWRALCPPAGVRLLSDESLSEIVSQYLDYKHHRIPVCCNILDYKRHF